MDFPLKGFPGGHCKKLMLADQIVIRNLQAQIDLVDKAYKPHLEDNPTDSETEDESSESQPPAKRPRIESPKNDSSDSGSD